MKRVLVTYATMAGSTAEVAHAVGEELINSGLTVDVIAIKEINSIEAYDAVIVGAPMIMGFHRSALRFLKKHREEFKRIPLAVFVMAMSLTQTDETSVLGVQVYLDNNLPKPPQKIGSLTFRERYARLSNYLQPIFSAIRPSKPVNVGVFGGRLEYGRLKWWAVLFAMLIIQAPAGERRNWPSIRSWAATLPSSLNWEEKHTPEVT
jgi:menaquinone-dependent protoporphyrinogen oxidase